MIYPGEQTVYLETTTDEIIQDLALYAVATTAEVVPPPDIPGIISTVSGVALAEVSRCLERFRLQAASPLSHDQYRWQADIEHPRTQDVLQIDRPTLKLSDADFPKIIFDRLLIADAAAQQEAASSAEAARDQSHSNSGRLRRHFTPENAPPTPYDLPRPSRLNLWQGWWETPLDVPNDQQLIMVGPTARITSL